MNIFSANFKKNQIKQKDWFDFEKQFLIPVSLTGISFSAVSIFLNFLMGFNWVLIVVPFVGIAIFTVVFLMAKQGLHITFAKWLFIITTLLLVNIVWYYNYGAHGPWFFLLILLYSYLIFMMSGKQLFILSMILLVNIIILFFYEYLYPNALGDYPTNTARIFDFYSAIILSGTAAYVLMTIAKNSYLTQYKKAKNADLLKSSFLANMSHEIRTPLNAIVGFSNLLADGTIKDKEKEQYISIINNSNETLLQLIDDILDVSMIEANQVKINKVNFSANELLINLQRTYKPILEEKKKDAVQLKLHLPGESYWITSDQIRINQVLVNLLNNAIKFTQEGSIEIGFEPEEDRLKFYVKDTGIGIKEAHLAHLFDRFYKIEDDKRKLYRGTGIGLYLSKKIVEMLGGQIQVASVFGEGSVFSFYIPAEKLTIVPAKAERKPVKEQKPVEFSHNAVVLLAEDDRSSSIYFKKVMEDLNIRVLQAFDGREALKLFSENHDLSLVLLDIRLPGLSGLEILKELKKTSPELPVIAQTAFAMAGDEEKYLALGFDDYIAKPVKKDILIKKLQRFILK